MRNSGNPWLTTNKYLCAKLSSLPLSVVPHSATYTACCHLLFAAVVFVVVLFFFGKRHKRTDQVLRACKAKKETSPYIAVRESGARKTSAHITHTARRVWPSAARLPSEKKGKKPRTSPKKRACTRHGDHAHAHTHTRTAKDKPKARSKRDADRV